MQPLSTAKGHKSRSGICLTCSLCSVNTKGAIKLTEGAQNHNTRKNMYINVGLLKRGSRITAS